MIKKIIRLGTLLTIKESYLFSKNIYGLGVHPAKTLNSLSREKDRSQQLLIWGLPGLILTLGMGLVWGLRQLLATTVSWGVGAKTLAVTILSLTVLSSTYLVYWLLRLRREE